MKMPFSTCGEQWKAAKQLRLSMARLFFASWFGTCCVFPSSVKSSVTVCAIHRLAYFAARKNCIETERSCSLFSHRFSRLLRRLSFVDKFLWEEFLFLFLIVFGAIQLWRPQDFLIFWPPLPPLSEKYVLKIRKIGDFYPPPLSVWTSYVSASFVRTERSVLDSWQVFQRLKSFKALTL